MGELSDLEAGILRLRAIECAVRTLFEGAKEDIPRRWFSFLCCCRKRTADEIELIHTHVTEHIPQHLGINPDDFQGAMTSRVGVQLTHAFRDAVETCEDAALAMAKHLSSVSGEMEDWGV